MSKALDIATINLYGRALIEASAGTGKTYTIANLVLRLLLEPRASKEQTQAPLSIDQILIVTFTNAATEELRGRVRLRIKQAHAFLQRYQVVAKMYHNSEFKQELQSVGLNHDHEFNFCCEAIKEDDALLLTLLKPYTKSSGALEQAKTALKDALLQMDEAAIYTIHGFCQRVLQQHAFESGSYFDLNLVHDPLDELLEVATELWREQCYGQNLALSAFIQANYGDPSGLLAKLRPLIGRSDKIIPTALGLSEAQNGQSWQALGDSLSEAFKKAQASWHQASGEIKTLLTEHKALNRNQYRLTSLPARFADMDHYFSDNQNAYAPPKSFVYFTQEKVLGASKKDPLEHVFFHDCEKIQQLLAEFDLHFIQSMTLELERRFDVLKQERRQLGFDDLLSYLQLALSQDESGEFSQALAQQYPVAMIDEFQDTDPTQYAIFDSVYTADHLTLFMIGDPKQAIYSFRGADIYTYLKAKEQVGENACYTLGVNYRSVGLVVNSVNQLFLQTEQPFGKAALIDYPEVSANQDTQAGLMLNKQAKPGLSFGYIDAEDNDELEIDDKTGLIKKESAAVFAAQACATEIVQLLHDANVGSAHLAGKSISGEDIAVLVRDRKEAALIQAELKQRRVGSVFISRDSVFETLESMQLRMILSACHNPSSGALLRGVLGSALFGYTRDQLVSMADNGNQWEEHVLNFWRYHNIWQKSGFMAMWSSVMRDYRLAQQVVSLDDGERKLTNLLQLAELLQQASQETHGIDGLLAWFDRQLAQEQQEIEEQQLRLESDSTLVQVVTIHKSKGLEYPIVFLPFAFKAQKPRMPRYVTFYDKTRSSYLVDIGSSEKKVHFEQASEDRLSEDLRLYYVALTRPRYLCRLYWGLVKDVDNTALYHLLYQDTALKGVDPTQFKNRLADFVNSAGELPLNVQGESQNESQDKNKTQTAPLMSLYSLQVNNLVYSANGAGQAVSPYNKDQLQAKTLNTSIDRSWRMSSYSGLINKAHSPLETPDYDQNLAKDNTAQEELNSIIPPDSIFTFARGAKAGNFMHKVLEDARFDTLANRGEDALIAQKLASFGFDLEPWQTIIAEHFQVMVQTRLNPASGLALTKLSPQQCLDELEFYLPMAQISTPSLNRVFNQYRQSLDEKAPTLTLHFSDMQGMLKGFIDLVFEYQGQFFVADYKSNHLGHQVSDYHQAAMQKQMFDHKYDIQLLIYTLALHRYLQTKVADYCYDKHIGGAYYLFIRGLSGQVEKTTNTPYGVYYQKPELAHILALESVLLSAPVQPSVKEGVTGE